MNDKKICFISAVNDDRQYFQCLSLINALKIPNGFEVDVIPVRNATSMCSAYNKGMKQSDAKYKIYLHQDTYIINLNFIQDILNIFEKDSSIGMIGICGAKTLPKSCIWWESIDRVGMLYERNGEFFKLLEFDSIINDYEIVDCIDGLMIITNQDITWRDDIFDGWHFYDVSQPFEFKNNGYKTVVPYQNSPWCMHTRSNTNMYVYELYRQKFVDTYKN